MRTPSMLPAMKHEVVGVGARWRRPVMGAAGLAAMLSLGYGVSACSDEDVDDDGCSYVLEDIPNEEECSEQAVELVCDEAAFSESTGTCTLDGCQICE